MKRHFFQGSLIVLVALTFGLGQTATARAANSSAITTGAATSQFTVSNTLASFTVGAGTDRLLVVAVGDPENATDITSVTFNGTLLTEAVTRTDNFAVDEIWYLKLGTSASASTGDIVVASNSMIGNGKKFIAASAYFGVDQTTPVTASQTNKAGGTNVGSSVDVTSATGDLVFDIFDTFSATAAATITVGAGQTVIHDQSGSIVTGSFGHYETSTEPGAATTTMSWTSNATDILQVAINIHMGTPAAPSADLSITKTDGVTTATPGGSVTYTITASNAGPSNATGATVADTFPASLTATWTCVGAGGGTCTASGSGNINGTVNLPAGGSVTYTASASISASASGSLANTATVTAPGGVTDPTPGNNSATDTDTLAAQANLAITKTDGVTTATPGGSVTYTITASNAGPSNATGATVADTFPASLTATWTCVGAGGGTCTASGSGNINGTVNLPAGGSVTYTASASISASASGSLANTATVTAPGGVTDPTPGNNSATDTDTLAAQANLAITKTDGVTTATPGGSVTYTITASNAGPSNVTGATVADTFPASLTATWTCVGAGGGTCTASGSGNINGTVNLPAGGSVTYTASATISAAASGSLANTATVTAPGGVTDPTPGNNSATDTDTLIAQADLAITKTDGVTTATPGGSVTYTITASNAGPSNATGATVADTFPASLTATWTCVGASGGTCTASGSGNINDTVNLPAGGSVTYTASATINASASGSLANTATVTAPAGVTDPTPGNNSATDTDTLTAQADLAITKTDGVTTATPGGSVTYTITASNAGPSNATAATVADTFPASVTATWTCVGAGGGTCTASGSGNINSTVNLPAGGSVTYTASATISAAASGSLSNTATVTAPGGVTDPTPGNNSATDTDTLAAQADLAITKTDGVTTATPGGSVTYTITASNAGPSNATAATVADTFPANLTATWTCVGAGGGTCTASGSGNINDTVNLPAGGSVTYTASASISAAAAGSLANTATVTAPAGVTDPTPGNNSATDTDTLSAQADLAITKTDGVTSAVAGGSVTYTITASNAGPSNVTGATVADTFPASLTATWTCVGAGGGTCTASGSGNINDTVNLPAGGSVTYTASASISAAAAGSLSNTATVSSATTDPNPGNNSATDTDTIVPLVGVTINQATGQADPATTSPITFTAVFNSPVTGFDDPSDVTLSGTAGASNVAITGGPTTYTVLVSGMTSSGTVIVTIPAGVANGSQGEANEASTSTDNSVTFSPIAPIVTGIVRADADPTNAATVAFNVTFSTAVTSVDANDFALVTTGVSGASITNVTGSGATRTVSVNTGSGDGSIGLNVVDDDTIVDVGGIQLGGKGASNGNFTGEVYRIDKTAPTAGSLAVADITSAGGTTHSFTIAFSDNLELDIASLDGSNIRVTGPGGFDQLATFVSVTPATNGTPRTATYEVSAPGGAWDIADNGTYTISLEASQVSDTAGNRALARTLSSFRVTIASTRYSVYLPLVTRSGEPDLVVSVSINPNKTSFLAGEPVRVVVTVTNQGSASAAPFWVDLYLNPSIPPSSANQLWNTRCGLTPCFGMAWAVTSALAPGQSITLTPQNLSADHSIWPGWFAAGTSDLYVYADSFNPGVTSGAVAESNEANNRAELHGLSVTGSNPTLVGLQDARELQTRPVRPR